MRTIPRDARVEGSAGGLSLRIATLTAVVDRRAAEVLGVVPSFLRAYGLTPLAEPTVVKAGIDNLTIKVRTKAGDIAIRQYGAGTASIGFELELMRHLKSRGRPVPGIIETRQGVSVTTLAARPSVIFEFIDGQAPDPHDVSLRRRMGSELALCHLAVSDFRPVINPERNEFSDLARFDAMRSTFADSGFDRFLSDVAAFRTRETAFLSNLTQLPHGIVHGDLHPHNVLVRGTEVVALLDWGETCMTASFVRDLGQTMLMWSVTEEDALRPDVDWMRDVREGYELIRPLTSDEDRALNSAIRFACLSDAIRHMTTGVHPGLREASECGTYLQFVALTQLPTRFV